MIKLKTLIEALYPAVSERPKDVPADVLAAWKEHDDTKLLIIRMLSAPSVTVAQRAMNKAERLVRMTVNLHGKYMSKLPPDLKEYTLRNVTAARARLQKLSGMTFDDDNLSEASRHMDDLLWECHDTIDHIARATEKK